MSPVQVWPSAPIDSDRCGIAEGVAQGVAGTPAGTSILTDRCSARAVLSYEDYVHAIVYRDELPHSRRLLHVDRATLGTCLWMPYPHRTPSGDLQKGVLAPPEERKGFLLNTVRSSSIERIRSWAAVKVVGC